MTPTEIKQLRAHLGWAQAEMGFFFNVRDKAIGEWEAGRKTPNTANRDRLQQLAAILDYSPYTWAYKIEVEGTIYTIGETVLGLTLDNRELRWLCGKLIGIFHSFFILEISNTRRVFCAKIRKREQP